MRRPMRLRLVLVAIAGVLLAAPVSAGAVEPKPFGIASAG